MRAFAPLLLLAAACSSSAQNEWSESPDEARGRARWTILKAQQGAPPDAVSRGGEPVRVEDFGGEPRAVIGLGQDLWRNTYYDFPKDLAGAKDATVFDATCAPIQQVTKDFHDKLCVQGSGRVATGETLSFAKRDCACAAVCPRTGQKICFEKLDPKVFPFGRGAAGKAITPLRTIAVDTTVLALGTSVFVPEFVGAPMPDGKPHDGCFLAEDRGLKVVGRQIDVFTGDPELTVKWNSLIPSNQGVHVIPSDARCRYLER